MAGFIVKWELTMDLNPGIAPALYRCPTTGLTVDEWVADVVPVSKDDTVYDAITCRACNRIHLVNLSSGKVLAAINREGVR